MAGQLVVEELEGFGRFREARAMRHARGPRSAYVLGQHLVRLARYLGTRRDPGTGAFRHRLGYDVDDAALRALVAELAIATIADAARWYTAVAQARLHIAWCN